MYHSFVSIPNFKILLLQNNPLLPTSNSNFLHTVSRLVSSRDIRRRGTEEGRLLHCNPDPTIKPKSYPKPPVLRTLLNIHIITFITIVAFTWIDILPGIGRVSIVKRKMLLPLF